jgi:hypothetical protein
MKADYFDRKQGGEFFLNNSFLILLYFENMMLYMLQPLVKSEKE